MGAYFTHTDPSELLLEPGNTLYCGCQTGNVGLWDWACSQFPQLQLCFFLQDTVALEGLDRQVLVIYSDWLAGEFGWGLL